MIIDKVTLLNFKIYKGLNALSLPVDTERNICIIAGNNGYGKTSFLTSLLWCLYGKLMSDVDEKYRKEIYESGGYKLYCHKLMNRTIASKESERRKIEAELYESPLGSRSQLQEQLSALESFSVSLNIRDVNIPSIPCSYIEIKRTYNVQSNKEIISILVDGLPNELTDEVGPEIFINDFILPKEVARFFFFDAEKIVSLAEMKSIQEKRELSSAYTQVLGIKKYEDLRSNLENIRLRLKRQSASKEDQQKLEAIDTSLEQNKKLTDYKTERISETEEAISQKKAESNKLQEKLIREGSTMTLEEMQKLRETKENLSAEGQAIKQKMAELLDLAPFAIAYKKLEKVYEQVLLESELENTNTSSQYLSNKLNTIKESLIGKEKTLGLTPKQTESIVQIIEHSFTADSIKKISALLEYSPKEKNELNALLQNLRTGYSQRLKELTHSIKLNQSAAGIVTAKLKDAETKASDEVIKEIRKDKTHLDHEIKRLEEDVIDLKAEVLHLTHEMNSLLKMKSELAKNIELDKMERAKDEVSARLINELEDFIRKLKEKKKSSLEQRILVELTRLMHKAEFIAKVKVELVGDLMEVHLLTSDDQEIDKENLSKGEQQLYATALLKALVDESNIRFPVFIDSPLQKFDRTHALNIINEFYPNASHQVVLFPLLEKELSEKEYKELLPRVHSSTIIKNPDRDHSSFINIAPAELFSMHKEVYANV